MSNNNDTFFHKIYKHYDEKDADSIGWAFINEKTMIKFPFKFQELKTDEIRANILYVGLCTSDVQVVRNKRKNVKYPIIPGHEIIAEISMVGLDVKKT